MICKHDINVFINFLACSLHEAVSGSKMPNSLFCAVTQVTNEGFFCLGATYFQLSEAQILTPEPMSRMVLSFVGCPMLQVEVAPSTTGVFEAMKSRLAAARARVHCEAT